MAETSKKYIYLSVSIGLVGIGSFLLLKQSRRTLKVEAIIPRPHKRVFEMHLNPKQFYGVLRYTEDPLSKHYEVLNEIRNGNKLSYELSHVVNTPFGKKDIRSNPLRFNIDEENCRFDETFTAAKTTFMLSYQFSKVEENDNNNERCKVNMDIILTGPNILVSFFTRVKSDFENRFRITNNNIDKLLP